MRPTDRSLGPARWRAPGRVNLIGEHLDYNGGPVLPFAIDRALEVRAAGRADGQIVVRSAAYGECTLAQRPSPGLVEGWQRYVGAAIWAFDQTGLPRPAGLDISIDGDLTPGSGLSSSAALLCGVLCALHSLGRWPLDRAAIAALATRAEREFVGIPAGTMDPLAVMLSTPGSALVIDTATLETEQLPFDLASAGLELLVIETGVRHSLADGEYAARRAGCEAAAAELGLRWLCEATIEQLPGLSDPVARRLARHVVSETARVRAAVGLLREGRLVGLGPLLTASHRSLADDYEVSCAELDTTVDAALAAGALGARLTGGGFGGSAIALCWAEDSALVHAGVRRAFAAAGWQPPAVWAAVPASGAAPLPAG